MWSNLPCLTCPNHYFMCSSFAYCYHSVNVISFSLSQSDHIERVPRCKALQKYLKTNKNIQQVQSSEECESSLNDREFEKLGLPPNTRTDLFPEGHKKGVACIVNQNKKSCQGDLGSPVVYAIEGTARVNYFEQHFVLSSGFDCKLPAMAFTQVSNRQVLNWIRNVTGESFFLLKKISLFVSHKAQKRFSMLSSQ